MLCHSIAITDVNSDTCIYYISIVVNMHDRYITYIFDRIKTKYTQEPVKKPIKISLKLVFRKFCGVYRNVILLKYNISIILKMDKHQSE